MNTYSFISTKVWFTCNDTAVVKTVPAVRKKMFLYCIMIYHPYIKKLACYINSLTSELICVVKILSYIIPRKISENMYRCRPTGSCRPALYFFARALLCDCCFQCEGSFKCSILRTCVLKHLC